MISSPRIQEYITWIAPKEKAGLYMGSNFLAIGLGGGLSGLYTTLYGAFRDGGNPEFVWYTLAIHMILGIAAILIFTRSAGEFKELKVETTAEPGFQASSYGDETAVKPL